MSLPSEAEVLSIYVNRLADAHCAATRHLRGVKGEDPAMEWVSGIFSKVDNYDLASIFTDFLTPAETSLLKELDETFYTKHLALGQVMRNLTSTITLPIAVDRSIKDMMDDKGFKVWASASSDLVERLKKLTAKADDLPDAWFSHLTDGRVQMDLLSWSLHNFQDWMTAELRGRTTELVKSIMSNPTGLCGKALTEAKAALRDNAPDKQCGEFFELLCEAMGDVEQLTASSSDVNPFTTASRKEQSKSTERLGKATANLEYHLEDMKKDPSESIPALVGFSSEWIAEFVKHAKQAQAKAGDDQVTVAIGELKTAADKLSGLLDPCPDLSKPNSETKYLSFMGKHGAAIVKEKAEVEKHISGAQAALKRAGTTLQDSGNKEVFEGAEEQVSTAMALVEMYTILALLRNPSIRNPKETSLR